MAARCLNITSRSDLIALPTLNGSGVVSCMASSTSIVLNAHSPPDCTALDSCCSSLPSLNATRTDNPHLAMSGSSHLNTTSPRHRTRPRKRPRRLDSCTACFWMSVRKRVREVSYSVPAYRIDDEGNA